MEEKEAQQKSDCKFIREETTFKIDNLNKINFQSKAKILELMCIIRQKDAEIEAEAKATTLLQQIQMIENLNKKVEKNTSPQNQP